MIAFMFFVFLLFVGLTNYRESIESFALGIDAFLQIFFRKPETYSRLSCNER